MKRDMDLVREILLEIEKAAEPPRLSDIVPEEDVKRYESAGYHLHMLINEVGLVRGIDASSMDGHDWIDLKLTWHGHEFLNDIRDPEIWQKAKDGAAKVGNFSLDILSALAKEYVKAKIRSLTGLDIGS